MVRIKFERLHRRLSQSSLATAAGIDASDYAQIELGRFIPRPVVLARLAEVLGLSPDVELLRPVEICRPEERPRDATTGRYVKKVPR